MGNASDSDLPACAIDVISMQIRQRLMLAKRPAQDGQEALCRAAVAIALFEKAGSAHFLMIKRVSWGSNPGQWALPGGRTEGAESIVETAVRELREETGLETDNVLGMLDDFSTSRGITITPIVVQLRKNQRPHRNPAEVASLHPIPLSRLIAPGVPRWKNTASGHRLLQLPLRHDMVVHAPTGAILWQFAEVALRGNVVRVAELDEPEFTAR